MATRILYKEVQKQLTQCLMDGEWKPGSMLPSEPKLAERYGVGISTIRAAVRQLEEAKILVRTQGKGTFVAHFDERMGAHRFLNVSRHDGTEEAPSRKLLALERIQAPPDIAELLQLPRIGRGNQVFRLSTLVSLAAAPIYHSNVFLPATCFPRLRESMLPDGSQSLYSLYQSHFNVHVIKVVDSLTAMTAAPPVAKLCRIKVGSPVLHLKRLAFGYNATRVEVRLNWINTAHHCYRIQQGTPDE